MTKVTRYCKVVIPLLQTAERTSIALSGGEIFTMLSGIEEVRQHNALGTKAEGIVLFRVRPAL